MHRTTPAIAALLSMPAFALFAQPALAAGCADAPTYERTIVCLVNDERRERGQGRLSSDEHLGLASDRHSADMVERGYFSHRSPGGSTPADRARRAGYLPRGGRWMVGEALAYATGGLATARSIVNAWMRSSAHRAVLLYPSADDIGVGRAHGTPDHGSNGVTVTLVVGRR